jgi:OOP family OmpA-OmpF porin
MSISLNLCKLVLVFLLMLVSTLMLGAAQANVALNAFGNQYQAVPAVSPAQSQVVYYRLGAPGEKAAAANLYVDQEFHTSLLPGGYTVFCLAPGSHSLNAVQRDEPRYAGKHEQQLVRFEGGRTLFLRVSETGGKEPQLVERELAEKELDGSLRQAHVLSRAASVKACEYQEAPRKQSYSLSGDVLFGFGRSDYRDIGDEARQAVRDLVGQLPRKDSAIEVVGHTDRIGTEAANQVLGLRRAQAVRQLLVENGIAPSQVTARSAGSQEPVTRGCQGGRQALIACYAPDRRVVIHVQAPARR